MKRTLFLLLATLSLAVVWPLTAQAAYQFITLPNYPGSTFSAPLAIDGGTMVGSYFLSSPLPCGPDVGRAYKYEYEGGVWTPLDYSESGQGSAEDIQGGNIVGGWYDNACHGHGFFFNGSTWTSLDYPGGGTTWAHGIDGGNIVGNLSGSYHGFLYKGGSWTIIDYPGAVKTKPNGIEGNNIVGYYYSNNNSEHGFLYNGSTWLTLDYPGAYLTNLFKLKGGTIAGYYGENVLGPYHGLLYKNGTWTTIDFPGATNTYLFGLDGSGNLVGMYQDNTGSHGFLASPIFNFNNHLFLPLIQR